MLPDWFSAMGRWSLTVNLPSVLGSSPVGQRIWRDSNLNSRYTLAKYNKPKRVKGEIKWYFAQERVAAFLYMTNV